MKLPSPGWESRWRSSSSRILLLCRECPLPELPFFFFFFFNFPYMRLYPSTIFSLQVLWEGFIVGRFCNSPSSSAWFLRGIHTETGGSGCHFYEGIVFHWIQMSTGKAMAPHSRTLAWKISWTEAPGRLQSMGLRRVAHD